MMNHKIKTVLAVSIGALIGVGISSLLKSIGGG